MKNNIIKILSLALVFFMIQACDQTDLDLRVSPNDLAADASDPNLLINSIQIAYAGNQVTFDGLAGQLTRIEYFFGRNYFNGLPGSTLDGVWRRTYSSGTTVVGDSDANGVAVGILTNLQALEEANANGTVDLSFHEGVAKTLYAHSLFQLVDFIGQASFSEAGNAADFPSPGLDSGEAVYAAAFGLLDEAEALLATGPSTNGATDLFYGGDTEAWIKLINTIRLRSYVLTGNNAAFNAIIASGNYISSSGDDFQLQYGTSELQPDNRHPGYNSDYRSDGAGNYRSNWITNLMLENDDPRRRYYFYRQQSGTPGALDINGVAVPPEEETLFCSLEVPPDHYEGFVYCSVNAGYWGRSHGDDGGGPPDRFQRTAIGVYPAAGRFDDNSFGVVGIGTGGGGAGITPILLSSYVDFWKGIMAGSDAERGEFMRSGLEKSIAKVQSFGALDAEADFTLAADADRVTAFIDGIVAEYNAATGNDKEDVFAEQYFVTLYGGATEAYNYYRLKGFPTTLFPNWEPDPGPFPRTFLIPQSEVINNPNVSQKADLTTQVFWDTNPPSPTFPIAN